jgi:hypothetical protein
MCVKINRKIFEVNDDMISDSLVFMLHAYHSSDYDKFAFWRRQFELAVKVDLECKCNSLNLDLDA